MGRCAPTIRPLGSSYPQRLPTDGSVLQYALWLWRDLYNWTRVHGALAGGTPAMTLGLAQEVWTVLGYTRRPVHVSDLQRDLNLEESLCVRDWFV